MSSHLSAQVARRSRRRDIDPAEVIAAALELFLQRGFAATRMEDVARAAGVSKGAIYLYFPTKEALFRAVVQAGVVPRIEEAEAEVANFAGSARELLSSLMHGLLLEFWDTPSSGIHKLVIADAHHFPGLAAEYFHDISLRARDVMVAIIRRGIASGEFRDVDVEYVARVILGALDQQAVLRHSMQAHDPEPLQPERFVDVTLDLIMNGLLK
ncbi:MAG: TetR/AcrR family transcriptional regulator [Gammaproteobacteria bacterium]|nr:TetR/AcrR family transcriptional regulator [Gammaproteobacteria bacterium]